MDFNQNTIFNQMSVIGQKYNKRPKMYLYQFLLQIYATALLDRLFIGFYVNLNKFISLQIKNEKASRYINVSRGFLNYLCDRRGSNPHGISTTGSLILRVCQFRHDRMSVPKVSAQIILSDIALICKLTISRHHCYDGVARPLP